MPQLQAAKIILQKHCYHFQDDMNFLGLVEALICQPYIILIHKYSKLLFQPVTLFFLQTRQVTNYNLHYASSVDYNRSQYIQKYSD